jgi:hypothetical protein
LPDAAPPLRAAAAAHRWAGRGSKRIATSTWLPGPAGPEAHDPKW